MKKLIVLFFFAGVALMPAFGFSSSPKFYATKVEGTPTGAGSIYGYRGGGDNKAPYDSLILNIPEWKSPDEFVTLVGDISMAQKESMTATEHPDGYKVLDGTTDKEDETKSVYALHMYFYAKPNIGYQFDGWFKDVNGNEPLLGSTKHYPLPGVTPYYSGYAKNGTQSAPVPQKAQQNVSYGETFYYDDTSKSPNHDYTSRWTNNGKDPDAEASGWYNNNEFNYLRNVYFFDKTTANQPCTVYVKFSVKPRAFVLEPAGYGASYTATIDGTVHTVTTDEVNTGNIDKNISFDLTYNEEDYVIAEWKWSLGENGTKTQFAGSTSTPDYQWIDNNDKVKRGIEEGETVHLWPILKDKASIIEVKYADDSHSYHDEWAEAFAAAKGENVNGATIILKKDVSGISSSQEVDRTITLDLNGHRFEGTANNLFVVTGSDANFTITDGTGAKEGIISLSNSDVATTYAVSVQNGGHLAFTGGIISNSNNKSDGSARGIEVQIGTTFEMTLGNIEAASQQNAYALHNSGTAIISGGNLNAHTSKNNRATTAVAFYNAGTSSTSVSGGTFSAYSDSIAAYGIQNNVSNTLTISNAVVRAEVRTKNAYSFYHSNGKITVESGKFWAQGTSASAPSNVTKKTLVELKGGVYNTYTNVRQCAADGHECYELEGDKVDYTAGYRFCVKSKEGHPRVCKVLELGNTTYYESLADALAYANNNPNKSIKIVMIAFEHTLPAGNYTLSDNTTLIVPREVEQIAVNDVVPREGSYVTPSLFRKLSFANGAHLEVFGIIEVGGKQNSAGQGANGAGIPSNVYSQIVMETGSSMTLNGGAKLYAWGFVTGSGAIDARRGSTVYEQFQMYDWKGGTYASSMLNKSQKVFPVNQYFIQNVEVATTYHPGSSLIGMTSINVSILGEVDCDNIGIVGVTGSGAMFLMDEMDDSENTWVRKTYDAVNDMQVYDINSSAELGSMVINMTSYEMDSRNYVLPITNNMKIHLLSGEMGITQSTVLLPGSEIEIDKTSTISINSGQSLYFYDQDEWGAYAFNGCYAQQVRYTPTFGGKPNKRLYAGTITESTPKPHDATLNVHGTFSVQGKIYTTNGGANIYSTIADAGTIQFDDDAPAGTSTVYQWKPEEFIGASCTSAKLTNDEGSTYGAFSPTAGTAAGKSFCFIDMNGDGKGEWISLTVDDDCFVYDNNGIYYAKPADYVALANGKEENPDHTYSSADGTRTFILVVGCQWWEVEYDTESGLYYCDKNDTYYYYDDSDPDPQEHGWKVKTYTITWQNWNGTTIVAYDNAHYGAMPEYLGSTPKRTKDDYYTYDFVGWAPALSPVTEDVTYIAQYERKDRMYTITWKDELGNTIENDYCKMGQIPVCYNEPDMTGKEWSPAVSAVTGDQVYTLTAKNNDGPFDIKFMNWDGVQIGETQSVAKDGTPVAPTNPSKAALTDIEFVFAGWRAANNTVYASNAIPAATENAVYTATFTEQPITYTILWKNHDNTLLETDENVTPNTVPQYNGATPTKPSDEENHYTFSGWSPAVVAATEDATYTAQFAATPNDKIVDDETYNVPTSTQVTVTNLIIKDDGVVKIPTTSRVNATNLYLEATSDASGQLITNANTSINITGSAYFDLTLNTYARHWHSFGVPWMVDLNTNPLTEVETGRTLTIGRDYDIMYYNGEKRAQEGINADCWEYVQDNGNTLTPGQGYMIAFTSAVKTLRFVKAAGAPVIFSSAMSVAANDSGTETDKGINAIANPMAYHAKLDVGVGVGQIHVSDTIGSDEYTEVNIENRKFIVGKAVYVKVPAAKSVVIAPAGNAGDFTPVAAPARRAKKQDEKKYMTLEDYYTVSLTPSNGSRAAKVYVLPMEEKDDAFITGQDLAKMSMSTKKAQIWVNRYESKLALNTTAPVNDIAQFPISVYAPEAGEYTISLQSQPDEEYTVYLTQDGRAFWNLSMDGCSLELAKGTNKSYGLRLVRSKAPQTATGIDEALVDAQGEIKKVIINDKVIIIRGDQVYSIDGQLVK